MSPHSHLPLSPLPQRHGFSLLWTLSLARTWFLAKHTLIFSFNLLPFFPPSYLPFLSSNIWYLLYARDVVSTEDTADRWTWPWWNLELVGREIFHQIIMQMKVSHWRNGSSEGYQGSGSNNRVMLLSQGGKGSDLESRAKEVMKEKGEGRGSRQEHMQRPCGRNLLEGLRGGLCGRIEQSKGNRRWAGSQQIRPIICWHHIS